MLKKEVMLLVLSSALNAAICFGAFVTAGFATSPSMRDVSMRIGYYVLNGIVLAALIGIFAPWSLARRRRKGAIFAAVLPVLLLIIAILAFLTLDSWLQRTFGA